MSEPDDTSPIIPELDDVPEDDSAEPADAAVDNPGPPAGEDDPAAATPPE